MGRSPRNSLVTRLESPASPRTRRARSTAAPTSRRCELAIVSGTRKAPEVSPSTRTGSDRFGFRLKLKPVVQRSRGRSHELTGGAKLSAVDSVRSRSKPMSVPASSRRSNLSSLATVVVSP